LVGFADPVLHSGGQWFCVVDENIVEMTVTYTRKFAEKGDRDASFLVSVEPLHVLGEFTLG
jgi:hypothetical protein